ncbi:MAG: hypothetical protein O9264_10310 [Leptospira sp.]|nr:hypothetical protein [Leptospira sp.]
MILEAEIFIHNRLVHSLTLPFDSINTDKVDIEIPLAEIQRNSVQKSPELQSIALIIQQNIHNIRKAVSSESPLAALIESGDISIHLKDSNGRHYSMLQILDIHYGILPSAIDFFECDADIDSFGYYLLCSVQADEEKNAIFIQFRQIREASTIKAVLEYRENRDLRMLDVGSGICLNVKSLTPDTDTEEDNDEIGQLLILERLLSKIQRSRISKKHRKRYYILGEKIFKSLQSLT